MKQSLEPWMGAGQLEPKPVVALVSGTIAVQETFSTYSDEATGEQQMPHTD
jgi:hypothetical protein